MSGRNRRKGKGGGGKAYIAQLLVGYRTREILLVGEDKERGAGETLCVVLEGEESEPGGLGTMITRIK